VKTVIVSIVKAFGVRAVLASNFTGISVVAMTLIQAFGHSEADLFRISPMWISNACRGVISRFHKVFGAWSGGSYLVFIT
jgi:hypothetical protein